MHHTFFALLHPFLHPVSSARTVLFLKLNWLNINFAMNRFPWNCPQHILCSYWHQLGTNLTYFQNQYYLVALCTFVYNNGHVKYLHCFCTSYILKYGSIIKTFLSFDTNFKPKNFSMLNDRHRLRWSRGSVLAFSAQVRGFKPGRSCRIFRAKKSSARLPSEGK